MAAILLLALGLRLFRLGADSIWYDEGVSLYLASLSIPDLIAHTAGDIHPPLYYLLLHWWLDVAGHSQFAAAFLSLFFGVLLIAAIYALARRFFGSPVASLAAFLAAISPYHLWYSQEMRMYTLGALLGVLAFSFMLDMVSPHVGPHPILSRVAPQRERGQGERAVFAYVLCAALGLYTLYYFAFLLVFLNVAALAIYLARPRSFDLRRWALAQIAVLILYLPWLPVAYRQATEPPVPPWRGFTGLISVLSESWTALSLGQSVEAGSVALALILIAIVYIAAGATAGEERRASVLLMAYTFVPVLLIYLASYVTPLFHVRYVFLYAPAFVIVLARGIDCVRAVSRPMAGLVVVVVLLASLRSAQAYFVDPAYAPDDHRAAVQFISRQARPGDAVLIDAGYAYPTFVYYYQGDVGWRGRLVDYARQNSADRKQAGLIVLQTGSLGGSATLGWGSSTSDFYATTEAETAAALDEVALRHERLWLLRIYDTVTDPAGFVRSYLDQRFLLLDDAGFGGASSLRVQLYRTYRPARTSPPVTGQGSGANLGNQARLAGFHAPPGPLYPAEASFLTIYWQAQNARPDLRAFVSMVDATGNEWAHWDDLPGGRLYPSSLWAAGEVVRQVWRLDVPVGTPAGSYRLEAGLYDGKSGARLDVLDGAGRSVGAAASLGSVVVGKARATVDITRLPVQQRCGATLGGEVRLAGYSLASRLAAPGDKIDLTVYWQGVRRADGERVVFVQLQDKGGKLWAAWEGPPVAAWDVGEVVRDHYRVLVPADAPDGELRLIIGVYRAGDKQRLAASGGLLEPRRDYADLGLIRVAGRDHVFTAPPMQQRIGARLGNGAVLLGYDLAPASRPLQLRPSDNLRLALYWQGAGMMDVSYTVFVQLLGPGDRLGGQHDAVPGDGLLPTTSWVKDEVLTDLHSLAVRPDAPPGEYRLVAGLYNAADGVRLPVVVDGVRQPGDMIVLATATVK